MEHIYEILLNSFFKDKFPTKQQIKNLILKTSQIFTFEKFPKKDYMKEEEYLKGYLIYFVPVNLEKLYRIFKELALHPLVFNKKDIKVIDIGCGPSPAIIPLLEVVKEGKTPIQYVRYIGVDQQIKVLEISKKLMESIRHEITVNYDFLVYDFSKKETYFELKEIKPEILVFSNSLGEAFDTGKISLDDFIKYIKYFTYKNDDFCLIIIEPATKKSSTRLHKVRDILIQELTLYPYAPCINSLPCSALKAKNWCYEERRWSPPKYLSFLKPIGLQLNYLKFSYVVLRKDKLNIKDTFKESNNIIKSISHLINEKGKSRLWGCYNGELWNIEKLKRDYSKKEEWLKIKKGGYFSVDKMIELSDKKLRIPKNAIIEVLYTP
ncbi:MAG: small ribosomal subunit Rsm22 family protein [Thermodesulfovibrionaceae bacterium]